MAIVGVAVLIAYGVLLLLLIIVGKRTQAGALARFVPDCAILFARLLRDPSIARWRKLVLVPLVAYLAMPLDLVPDFIPVVGQLDDVIVVVLALRVVLGGADAALIRRHWPGPEASLNLMLRLV